MPVASSSNASQRRIKRPYGNACVRCRQKKRSCDGARPACSNCAVNDEECIVPRSNRALSRRLSSSPVRSSIEETLARVTDLLSKVEQRVTTLERIPGEERDAEPEAAGPSTTGAGYRLTADEQGNITYHGVTGLVPGDDVSPSAPPQPSSVVPLSSLADEVAQNQALAPVFQALAASKHISVAPELGDALLQAYHCYEIFEITHQANFLRDMVLGGPCFSEFLLMILYAAASRMIDGLSEEQRVAQGDLFVKMAKAYLVKEMEGPTKITTIQGLLLLSSRECALGQVSQGWNHAGLAFRMIQDLGIHHNPSSIVGVAHLSLEDQATRDRLFWAAFIWDKALSLALGREPTMAPRPREDPMTLANFSDDGQPWTPYFAHPFNAPPSLQNYTYPKSCRSLAFRLTAKLCLIVHDIIMALYSSESRSSAPHAAFVSATTKRLDDLWTDVPSYLDPVDVSAPPHIFGFLIFFHASYIILHRPGASPQEVAQVTGSAKTCMEHSKAISALATKFIATFGNSMRYLARYSWFVAATYDVNLLQCSQPAIQLECLTRLSNWLETMESHLLRAPSIGRSVKQVSSPLYDILAQNPHLSSSAAGRSIKAFLLRQRGETSFSPNMGWMSNQNFDFLDLLHS